MNVLFDDHHHYIIIGLLLLYIQNMQHFPISRIGSFHIHSQLAIKMKFTRCQCFCSIIIIIIDSFVPIRTIQQTSQ